MILYIQQKRKFAEKGDDDIRAAKYIILFLIMASLWVPFSTIKTDNIDVTYVKDNEDYIERGQIQKVMPKEKSKVETTNLITHGVPSHKDNYFKAYMDFRCITDKGSKQWSMQTTAYTDENGIRKIGDYYCIALGSGFGSEMGTKFKITLDSGIEFLAILADQKANIHTDHSNKYIDVGNRLNIVEFIVQDDALPAVVKTMGDINHMPGDIFKGNIVKIEEIEQC